MWGPSLALTAPILFQFPASNGEPGLGVESCTQFWKPAAAPLLLSARETPSPWSRSAHYSLPGCPNPHGVGQPPALCLETLSPWSGSVPYSLPVRPVLVPVEWVSPQLSTWPPWSGSPNGLAVLCFLGTPTTRPLDGLCSQRKCVCTSSIGCMGQVQAERVSCRGSSGDYVASDCQRSFQELAFLDPADLHLQLPRSAVSCRCRHRRPHCCPQRLSVQPASTFFF